MGTASLRDHLFGRAFVADVLLYTDGYRAPEMQQRKAWCPAVALHDGENAAGPDR